MAGNAGGFRLWLDEELLEVAVIPISEVRLPLLALGREVEEKKKPKSDGKAHRREGLAEGCEEAIQSCK